MSLSATSATRKNLKKTPELSGKIVSIKNENKWHQSIRNKAGYLFFNIASICSQAPCKLNENIKFLKLSHLDPKAKNYKEMLSNLVYKVYLVAIISLYSIVSLFTSPVAFVFRILAHYTQFSEFNYKKGCVKEKPYPTDNKATIYFLNTCLIPAGYSLTHGAILPWDRIISSNKRRIDLVVEKILQNESDIICLSEVYDFKAAEIIYNKLKNKYSHFYINIGPHPLAIKSGLLVASKYKIQNPHFIDFHDTLIHNKGVCRRGAFAFDAVDRKNKLIAQIYSAHLEYSEDDSNPSLEEQKARKDEVDLIIQDIRKRNISNSLVVLTGDLNFPEEEYKKTNLITYFNKISKDKSGTCRGGSFVKKLWNEKIEDKDMKGYDLDHTFILKKSPIDSKKCFNFVAETKISECFDKNESIFSAISDHHAIETTIALS